MRSLRRSIWPSWSNRAIWSLAALLAAVLGVRYAEPILDGDLFFHLAYARQMLASGSLVPDHTLYSWTPTSNGMIYCSWLSEFALYGLWRALGLPALFALRYAVVAGTVLLLWLHCRRSRAVAAAAASVASTALTFLILTLVAVGARSGSLVKPELFSLLFLHLVLCVYFRAKSDPCRSRGLWLVPAIVILWVNSHGGFILLAPFLVGSAAGELANRKLSPGLALTRPALLRLLGAWGLCGLAVLATPYGWSYPRQLVDEYLLQRTPRPDTAWNNAYQAVLAWPNLVAEHLPLLVLMALVLVALLAVQAGLGAAGARWDWAVVLVNAAYVPLYLLHIRSTYWWAAIFGWSAIHLLARGRAAGFGARLPARFAARAGAVIGTLAVLATLWLSVRTVRAAWLTPLEGSWVGFGVAYINPVAEAEYLAQRPLEVEAPSPKAGTHLDNIFDTVTLRNSATIGKGPGAGTRLYNIFDSGSYLLWRLSPRYRVMTDSRSFPYLAWFEDQYHFTQGDSFAEFLDRYPADVAVIDHRKYFCQRNFLDAPAWRPVFYGPTAVVFERRRGEPAEVSTALPAHGGIDRLRNGSTALAVFEVAVAVGDDQQAWSVLEQMEGPLRVQLARPDLEVRRAYRSAYHALVQRDFESAHSLLRQGLAGRPASARDRQALLLLEQRRAALVAGQLGDAAVAEGALQRLAPAA